MPLTTSWRFNRAAPPRWRVKRLRSWWTRGPLGYWLPDICVGPSAGSWAGAKYRTASGNQVSNQSEKMVTMTMEEGVARAMTFQIIDVTKPLPPAGRITSKVAQYRLGRRRLLHSPQGHGPEY